MKKCPTCEKIYDDSWGVCLCCNAALIQGEKDQAHADNNFTLVSGIKKRCYICKQEYPEETLSKPEPDRTIGIIGWISSLASIIDTRLVCSKCVQEQSKRADRVKIPLLIAAVILFVALFASCFLIASGALDKIIR